MENSNPLRTLIKLRHLKKASENNWQMLRNTQMLVNGFIADADQLMDKHGSTLAKEQFLIDLTSVNGNIGRLQELLDKFHKFIDGTIEIDIKSSFQIFTDSLANTSELFDVIASYPANYFNRFDAKEWKEIWVVIKSNMSVVQGVGEAAYIKSMMIRDLNDTEVDILSQEIIKHIPESFNLMEAERYKKEYLQAVEEIEKESNARNNLWDRFLNILAGSVPFKQSPEERVMMRRWLDGEKGEL